MSTTPNKTWAPANREIIDIGGSKLNNTFDTQLPQAFKGQEYFPKEVAYTTGMDKWCNIADSSYQTFDEMKIIEATAGSIAYNIPTHVGTIIDLGAANSLKFEPYVKAFLAQNKTCVYVALDICRASLNEHVDKAATKFPGVLCVGLWGNFQQGDLYFHNIPGPRVFLSLGSIFYNAPDNMCVDRCVEFKNHMASNPFDCLIVGQDGPSATESTDSHKAYGTKEYHAFFTTYLAGHSDRKDDLHPRYNNFIVEAGTEYTMFPSWKRGEEEIHKITKEIGLNIRTLGKAANSGMRQYIIQPQN
ncbi:uncharacterized protein FTOL_02691 [Fusarium torulosum]|uniref:Histidine-specific methyltransferase SAM-dependent domain-containing protein n=1 Tax=Fusarium torulosum TaxID=33205 RepID=A0AAE8SEV1_9HYPO|nr:uncharacterized protein FTOL_02691 [Fusarium torulosum]